MTAATAAVRIIGEKAGGIYELPVGNAETLYAGTMVMVSSDGRARAPAADSGAKGCPGVAIATYDNSSGANDAINALVQEGEYQFIATSIAQTAVGSIMYATDNQTFDESDAGNRPKCGLCTNYISATSGRVLMSWATMKLS